MSSHDTLCFLIAETPDARYHLAEIALRTPAGWRVIATGLPGAEFSTSLGSADADTCEIAEHDGTVHCRLAGRGDGWEAEEEIVLVPGQPLRRRQTYRFLRDAQAAAHPGLALRGTDLRYTCALQAHAQPPAEVPPLRAPVDWAVPLPCHVWHAPDWVACYGVDRTTSPGTPDFTPPGIARVYYPETGVPADAFPHAPGRPETAAFRAGDTLTLVEFLNAVPLQADDEPLLEAERLAAAVLLAPRPLPDLPAAADGIARFYAQCDLWHPDALGPGRGWFSNMWVFTQSGTPAKQGWMSGYFDLGWGEGIAVEAMMGITRHWRRTGHAALLPYVDEMTRNMALFKRGEGDAQPYYDRSDGRRFGDFLMDHVPGDRIWLHSLGHLGSQLVQLHAENPDYPDPAVRGEWLAAARSIAGYCARVQRADGDLPDIVDADDREVNNKPHRIAARAVVCGLWARLGGEDNLARARRLARAVAPEIDAFAFYNQMIDGIIAPAAEFVDGEAAYYVLEGLAPLYAATGDPGVLALCRRAAAFGIAWTYFYDLPHAHRGIARGGQCCRMPDFPLLYPIGPAKAVEPLLALHAASGDDFFRRMAEEMVAFIGHYTVDAPGRPWDGGIVHAIGQYCGKHWGPELGGQVDSGMATGNSLAAIECWLAYSTDRG